MPLLDLGEGEGLRAAADDVAVVVGPLTDRGTLARCLQRLLAHTAPGVPIVLLADAATDPDCRSWLAELDQEPGIVHEVRWLDAGGTASVGRQWAVAAAALARADLLMLHVESSVGDGWLDGLCDAARSAGNLATATALSNHAAFASAPHRNLPWPLLPPELTVDEAARRVRDGSLRIRPRLPTALAHCALVSRAALDLTGGFDERFESGEDALADFSQRCLALGLQHVLADDVFVAHRGGAGGAGGAAVHARHPDLAGAVAAASDDRWSALARAVSSASRSLVRMSVTIDGRCLTPGMDGTRLHTLELIGALARSGDVRLRVVLPDDLGTEAQAALARVSGLELIAERDVGPDTPRTAIAHRPWQVFDVGDLELLDRLGERTVITTQDLIAYRNREAFAALEEWLDYRRLTGHAMGVASTVLFFTEEAAGDALADDLVPPDRVRVVPIGVDHHLLDAPAASAGTLPSRPFLLCLGNRFRHKNLVFALRLLERLRTDHGWDGDLVVAGAEALHGSSSGDEAAYLGLRAGLAEHVRELGAVSEGHKRWLLEHAAAVLYPSTYEGFGLIPFEAAAAGTPTLFAPVSALIELLPAEAATLIPWDPALSAGAVADVLGDGGRAQAIVDLVGAAGSELTWTRAARGVLDAYAAALDSPAPPLAASVERIARVEHDYWKLRGDVGATGLALVNADDGLLDEASQRGLARIVSRRWLRRMFRAGLRLVSRA